MEVLASELARLLNITVEKAVELYPVIKQQFISFKIIDSISNIFGAVWLLSIIIGIVAGVMCVVYMEYANSDDTWNKNEKKMFLTSKKVLLISFLTLITSILGNVVCNVFQYTLSPDFMIMSEFLLK